MFPLSLKMYVKNTQKALSKTKNKFIIPAEGKLIDLRD